MNKSSYNNDNGTAYMYEVEATGYVHRIYLEGIGDREPTRTEERYIEAVVLEYENEYTKVRDVLEEYFRSDGFASMNYVVFASWNGSTVFSDEVYLNQ